MSELQPAFDFISQHSTALTSTAFWLSPPGRMLVNRCSDYLGVVIKIREISMKAKAEKEAERIKALPLTSAESATALVLSADLEEWSLIRLSNTGGRKQANMENVFKAALDGLNENARPQDIDEDFLSNFFDKSTLVSHPLMQVLLGKILSGEANAPGTYSKRTVTFVQQMSKEEAEKFLAVCNFCVEINGEVGPIIPNLDDEIFQNNGLTHSTLLDLAYLGLVGFDLNGFSLIGDIGEIFNVVNYFDNIIGIQPRTVINRGPAMLSPLGQELFKSFSPMKIADFSEYLTKYFSSPRSFITHP